MPDKSEDKDHIPPMHLNFLTPLYDTGCSLMGLGSRFRSAVITRAGITGEEKVLDAGCGTGALLIALKERHPSVSAAGLDPDKKALEIAGKKSRRNGLDIIWHRGFMEGMPFEEGSFDIVVSTLAFHHILPDKRLLALMECHRVLKPMGRIVLVDISPDGSGLLGRMIYRILGLFEHLSRPVEIFSMMRDAGFSEVRKTGSYPYGIIFIEGLKAA